MSQELFVVDELSDEALPSRIANSWSRSLACGLQRSSHRELPYSAESRDDSALLRAAEPVLDRLDHALADAPTSVMLADQNGYILDQRMGGHRALRRALDVGGAAPGVLFAEEFAGTNGVGTPLEDASITTVHGDQHFADNLRHLSCVGVPIRHPITNSIRGVLDLTTLVEDYNPLIAPLMLEAVKHIETRLTQFSGAYETVLMEEFRRVSTKYHGPVVAIAADVFLANTAAAGVIQPFDHTLLWDLATSVPAERETSVVLALGGGSCVATCVPVAPASARERAYVIRLDFEAHSGLARRRTRPGRSATALDLPGRSTLWRRAIDDARKRVNDSTPLVILGEDGLGKGDLARQLLAGPVTDDDAAPGDQVLVRDADGTEDEEIARTLRQRKNVVLRSTGACRLDHLHDVVESARSAHEEQRGAGRLVLTVRLPCAEEHALEQALTGSAHFVHLPPLRRRPEDVADIVPVLLRSIAGAEGMRCSPSAMQLLMKARWTANVEELDGVLRHARAETRTAEISPADLPHWLMAETGGRALSTYERSERELIIETLRGVDGNRAEAARILGIGRSTLYRKMRSLSIPMAGRHVS